MNLSIEEFKIHDSKLGVVAQNGYLSIQEAEAFIFSIWELEAGM